MQKFDFNIYPRKLWVGSPEELTHFVSRSGEELESPDNTWGACMYTVMERDSKLHGFFVIIDEESDISHFAHEATHVALTLCVDLDIEVDTSNQEILAYLVGFITQCISQYANQSAHNGQD